MHSKTLVGAGLVITSSLALLPFLLLCLYWHPVGTHAVDWVSNWGGRYDGVSWAAQQLDWYRTTMGRYTSTALLSTTHYWYSLPLARLAIVAWHLLLGAAVYYCVGGLWAGNRSVRWVVTLTVLSLFVSQLSNPYDSLYRLTGLLIYQTGLIATLLFAGALGRGKIGLATLLVVIAAGTNEISLLQCGLLLGGFVYCRPARLAQPRVVVLLVVALVSAGVAVLAPGNWVRAAEYGTSAYALPQTIGLVVAAGGYTWLTWLSSTALLPLSLLAGSFLPRVRMRRSERYLLALLILAWPFLSFAPVLLATRGESFPEGIADWQIIPIGLLLAQLLAGLPRWTISRVPTAVLLLFTGSFMLVGGLGIDRQRSVERVSSIDRIVVAAPPGNAWRQLLTGKSAAYSRAVARQYASVRACKADTCVVDPLPGGDNYLYDASYDRRISAGGDDRFGSLVNRDSTVVVSFDE